jgi:leucyl aminopeptidase
MLNISFVRDVHGAVIIPVMSGQIPLAWREAAEADGFTGEPETVCEIFGASGRVVLVGLGDGGVRAAEAAGACAVARLLRVPRVAIDVRGVTPDCAAALAAGACLRAWRFDRLRTRADDDAPLLVALDLVSGDPAVRAAWATVSAGVEGALFARDLVTEPSDTLTPAGFVARLAKLVQAGVSVEVMDVAALTSAGFGGLLAVGQGSDHPPCLAVLRWKGSEARAPVAFVGKGITFDTGGICIKPADDMWHMRADMAGAAACAGAMLALARRGAPVPAIAVLPLAENATGAASYRPGDVLRMLSGTTVQVVDTDAEGRLVLADALTFALREKPAAIVDLATLTGSIVTALGHEMAGAFGNDVAFEAAVAAAGAAVGEFVWRMPIAEGHRRALDSDIADLKHCVDGRGQPDACQAAAFLREFVDETPWVHLDIAGVESCAEADGRFAKGATGFGVRLLDRLVADRFENRPAHG